MKTYLIATTAFASTAASMLIALAPAEPAAADAVGGAADGRPWQRDDGSVVHQGKTYGSWAEYRTNTPPMLWRCGTPTVIDPNGGAAGEGGIAASTADCSNNLTNPLAEYDAATGVKFCIPVVVHVLRNTAGTLGNVPSARIIDQINVLNRDFNALLGGTATNCKIEFYLATRDPSGAATPGYVYYNNDTWYNDGGSYFNTIAWDTTKYLNIYTNTAGGNLGYVPALPSGGTIVGTKADRVVIDYQSFGTNSAYYPYDLGRTTVHEVGHWMGLYHTFQDGCGTNSCYTTGDRICDTNKEQSAHFGCGAQSTCSDGGDPIDNFMDYSDDRCMTKFTPEQAKRMRCTMLTWRVNFPRSCARPGDINGDGVINGSDLGLLLNGWGTCGNPCPGDLNADGFVNGGDLGIQLSNWG